mmetsp:Transcript_76090/g.213346  ORF Transcript_76090/g.213346 Transcript_76090/m.213346 type:complete len:164 (+) Transcript_76090:3-494(+)
MAGTNDMGCLHEPARIVQSLELLHAACHARGVPTVALAPPPAPSRGPMWEAIRGQVLNSLRLLAAMGPARMACIDPAELVSAASPEMWDADGLHFSPLGSCTFGQSLASAVLRTVLPLLRPGEQPAEDLAARPDLCSAAWGHPWQAGAASWCIQPVGWVLVQV